VDFKLVPVPENHYPFHQGQVWAEPDEGHAAWQMRQVFHNRAEAERRADAARMLLKNRFGADACGDRMRSRCAELASATGLSAPLSAPSCDEENRHVG
jgi:hypothetical protein